MKAISNSLSAVLSPDSSRTSRLAYSLIPTVVVVLVLTVHTLFMTSYLRVSNPVKSSSVATELSPELSKLALSVEEVLERLDRIERQKPVTPETRETNFVDVKSTNESASNTEYVPDLFIYRRTKKTGSSSMLAALLNEIVPRFDYFPLYLVADEMYVVVRQEFRRTKPRRLFIAQHNGVRRDIHPNRRAIIADTFRNGYDQITSYCRFVKNVEHCDSDEMLDCLAREDVRAQREYRWSGRDHEDDDTYIDIPLSSAHPALSTTVLRSFFGPNITLDIRSYNVYNSSCPEIPALRDVYDQWFAKLDSDVEKLSKRFLILAGYTIVLQPDLTGSVSMAELLDASEAMEQHKYERVEDLSSTEPTKRISDFHKRLNGDMRKWVRNEDGELEMKQRF